MSAIERLLDECADISAAEQMHSGHAIPWSAVIVSDGRGEYMAAVCIDARETAVVREVASAPAAAARQALVALVEYREQRELVAALESSCAIVDGRRAANVGQVATNVEVRR